RMLQGPEADGKQDQAGSQGSREGDFLWGAVARRGPVKEGTEFRPLDRGGFFRGGRGFGQHAAQHGGFPTRRRHRGERHALVDLHQAAPPAAAHREGREVGAHLGRRPVGLFEFEQAPLQHGAVHGFSPSGCGVRTHSSFCRALKTRQRAVSSVRPSTSAIWRNDNPSSTRNRKAARNSVGNRRTAAATSSTLSRVTACSAGPSSRAATSSGNGCRLRVARRASFTYALCPMRNSQARKLLPGRKLLTCFRALRKLSWARSSAA